MILNNVGEINELLLFDVSGDRYAIDAASVEEIIFIPHETLIPSDSSAMSIISHKSEIFTTVSLRSVLSEAPVSALDDDSRLAIIAEMKIADGSTISGGLKRLAFKISDNPPYRDAVDFGSREVPSAAQFNRNYLTHILYDKLDDNRQIKFVDLKIMVGEMFYND